PGTVDAIKRRHVKQLEEQVKAGPRWQDTGFIFTRRNGEPVRSEVLLTDHFRPLLKASGRDGKPLFPPAVQNMRIHDLRHSAASLLLAAGMSPTDVAEMLGHSSPYVT